MLCVPNLAALQLEPQWVRIDEKRYHLVHEIRYSELSNRWEGFCHWSKSRKQEEFSQVVAEWCRQRRSQIDQADAFRPSLINASTTASASRFSGSDIVPLLDPTLQAVSDNHHSKKRTYQANKNAEHGYIESVSRIVTDPQKRQRQAEDGTTDCGSIGIQQLGAGVGAGVGSRATTTADVARVSSQTNTMFEETASMTAHQMATANDLATDWTSAWESNEPFQPIFLPGMYELDSDLWNDGHDLDEVSSDLFQSELPS